MIQSIRKHYVKIILVIAVLVIIVAIPYQVYQSGKYNNVKKNLESHLVKESVVENALTSGDRKGKLVYIYDPNDLKKDEDPQTLIDIAKKYNVDFMTIDNTLDKDAMNFLKPRTDINKLRLPIYVYFDQTATYITFARLDKQELINKIKDSGIGLRGNGSDGK